MAERPILFSGAMVRAILDGAKTQTRRVLKVQPEFATAIPHSERWQVQPTGAHQRIVTREDGHSVCAESFRCPYGVPGDRLWVRETWRVWVGWGEAQVECAADDSKRIVKNWHLGAPDLHITGNDLTAYDHGEWCNRQGRDLNCWRPSIHMPRAASRLTLEITDVRVERLTSISEGDARAEGCDHAAPQWPDPRDVPERDEDPGVVGYPSAGASFARDNFRRLWDSINGKRPGCSWADDPWVWVVSFRRVEVPGE